MRIARGVGLLVGHLLALPFAGGVGGIVGMALFLAAMGGGPGRGEEPESFLAPLRLSFLLGGMPGLFLGILLGVQSARRETAPRWRYPLLGAFLLGGLFTLVTTLILLGR